MALWGPVAYQVSLVPLPDKGAFVATKKQALLWQTVWVEPTGTRPNQELRMVGAQKENPRELF